MTRVLVVGGGVGGLTLAQALTQAGVPVEVFERTTEAADWLQGYRIHVNRHGSRALHRCLPRPLWEAFTATAGRPGLGLAFQTEQLSELMFVEEELMTGGSDDPADGNYAVSRIALRRLLLAGLKVHFGRTFERYELGDDGTVTAFFADGTTATGDVLIGADGANSLVRGQFLPGARRVDTEVVGVAGRLRLDDETRAWLPTRIQNGMNIVLPRGEGFLFSAVFDGRRRTADALGAGLDLADYGLTSDALLDDIEDYVLWAFCARAGEMDGLIRGWHPDLRRMIADADPATVYSMRFKTSTPVEPWPTSRVTLLGDAIHNMTPVMGLGANTALRDAALLARQLIAVHRGEAELLPALHEYERRMLAYGFEAVETSRSSAYRFTSSNVLAKQGMRAWLRMCSAVPSMKRSSFGSTWTDDTAGG